MSFFFEEDTALQVKSTESISKGERTDFMENASKAFKAFRRSEIFTSEGNNQEEEYINIVRQWNRHVFINEIFRSTKKPNDVDEDEWKFDFGYEDEDQENYDRINNMSYGELKNRIQF